MNVLVTGCAGFIGSHLCERLLAEGNSVTGVDALTDFYDPRLKRQNLERPLSFDRFRFVHRPLLEIDESLTADTEVIFHLAARAGVRTSWGREFEQYVRYNILSTQHLLECAGRSQNLKRLVFSSSSSVYGNTQAERVAEDHPQKPVSPYGVTKLAAEHLCSVYGAQSGTPAISLRLFTVYGPRQRPDMAFHRLIHAALTRTKFVLYGDGRQQRDFTFVSDAAEGLMLAANSAAPAGSYNIAGGAIVSMHEAIGLVEEIVGSSIDVERASPQSGDVWHTGADLSKSRDVLGYAPRVGLREGLKAQIESVERMLAKAD